LTTETRRLRDPETQRFNRRARRVDAERRRSGLSVPRWSRTCGLCTAHAMDTEHGAASLTIIDGENMD